MTLVPPVITPVSMDAINVSFRANQDLQPFSYRSTMTYGELQNGIKNWIFNVLVPYLNANFQDIQGSWIDNVQQILDTVDKALADQSTANAGAIQEALADIASTVPTTITDPQILAALQASGSQSRDYIKSLTAAGSDGYDIIILAGQSNMSGRGTPFNSITDPINPSIFQYNSSGPNINTIQAASEPLSMHDVPSGIGPGLQFARWYASRRLAANRKILLIPVAHGGTPLSSNNTPLGWRPGVTGNLYANLISHTQGALTKANAQYTTAGTNRIVALLWHQGETDGDNGITADTYRADLDSFIRTVRLDLSVPSLPVIVGTMVPEFLSSGTRVQIDAVHRDTPNRNSATDIAIGPSGSNMGDGNHYNADGQRLLGRAYFDAYDRIIEGLAPVQSPLPATVAPVSGLAVSASDGHSITVTYPTVTGATGYLVEFRETGTTTWQVAFTTTNPTTYILGGLFPSTKYDIRVTPMNGSAKGFPTTITANTQIATTLISDSFNRADSASALGNSDTGNAWIAVTGTFGIAGNYAYHGTAVNDMLTEISSGVSDCVVQATFAVLSNAAGAVERLVFRGDGTANNYWALQYRQTTNTYQLYKWVGGVVTQVGSDLAAVPRSGDVVTISMTASAIEIRVNGVTQLYVVDSDNKTNTYHGLGGKNNSNLSRFDNFSVSR